MNISITDNGRGFNVEQESGNALKRGSLGIVGMKERARLLGGDLRIDSSDGNGCSIKATIPVKSRRTD